MKKLFALLVVTGMVFFSCGSTNTEPEVVEEEVEIVEENTMEQDDATMELEESPVEEVAE